MVLLGGHHFSPAALMIYEPRTRNASLYTLNKDVYSSDDQALAGAKQRFIETSDYEYDEVVARKLEETETDSTTIISVVVAAKHAAHMQQ